jgi:serine protease
LNFGSGLTSVEVEFRNSGDAEAPLTIDSISISSEIFLIAADSQVDDNGLGSYMITVDRTDLPEGTSEFTLEVTSNVSTLSVPISIRNVPPAAPLNAGPMHVILLDASSLEQTSCALVSPVDGVYSANFDSVPSGDYFALAGSDTDGDGLICGPFEACGAFQSLGDLQQITDADVNFSITYSLFAPFPSGQFGSCD